MTEKCSKGDRPGSRLLDRVFQQMIEIDMRGDFACLSEDMEDYVAFIKELEGMEEEQGNIAGNLILFAHYIDRETYREPFRKLLDEVTASGIMKNRVHIGTLHSGYVALGSYRIHEERQVSEFMKNMLFASAEIGTPEDQKLDEEIGLTEEEELALADMSTELLLRKYFAKRRMLGILEEFQLVETEYPEHYECVADFVQELRADPEGTGEKYLEELYRSG